MKRIGGCLLIVTICLFAAQAFLLGFILKHNVAVTLLSAGTHPPDWEMLSVAALILLRVALVVLAPAVGLAALGAYVLLPTAPKRRVKQDATEAGRHAET